MIITIDGPAGVGKSTIAKILATKLKFSYFDTGAMYRSVTFGLLKNEIDIENEDQVKNFLKNRFKFETKEENSNKLYFVNNEDVTDIIRSDLVTSLVSKVSAKKYIRDILLPMQRKFAENVDIVCEGRDMGTHVFPNADLKIYLTARATVRAKRRFKELVEKYPQNIATLDKNKILEDIKKRDETDSTRKASPLKKAKDAYLVDTSNLTKQEVVEKILKKAEKGKKIKLSYNIVRILAKVLLKIFFRLKIYGEENLIKGPAIIASNHVSFIDPPVVAASIKEELHFIAKEPLFKIPIFKTLIKILNSHPISENESNIKTIKDIKFVLKKGKKVVLFPEGTRSKDGKLRKLLPGIGFIMGFSKCTIIPTIIYGADKVWNTSRKFPKLFEKISIIFGKPIKFDEFENIDKKHRNDYILSRVENALKTLQKELESKTIKKT